MTGTVVSIHDGCYVIFGAAVRADGAPSGTLRRRVAGALALAHGRRTPCFLVTGGVGRHGPAEAVVMRDLLTANGVPPAAIMLEDRARDTLESVYRCQPMLKRVAASLPVVVCSSRYHMPRCALLFRLLGIPAETGAMPSDRAALGTLKWIYYWCREVPATLWDITLVFWHRRFGRRTGDR